MHPRLFAVTRSFQGGATFATFNQKKFDDGVARPIAKLLRTAPAGFAGIAVVTCAEVNSKFAEEVRGDLTPTTAALKAAFPEEVRSGLVVPVLCGDWGLNAGSASAINAGIEQSRFCGADQVLVWSPEIDLDGHMVTTMQEHMDRHALELVGYCRNFWFEKLPWMFAQNTCAIWNADLLKVIDGMNPACNGDGKSTVTTEEFGDVALAGMEDMEAYFRASAQCGTFLRWGIAGLAHPAVWNLALKEPGTREYDDNQKKIARQSLVALAYAARIFPHMKPREVIARTMMAAKFG